MKKFLTLALTVLLAMCLFGCQKQGGGEGEPAGGGDEHYDVVLFGALRTSDFSPLMILH